MRNFVLDAPIFLYGPSGTGKSTAGKILANRLDREFIDLDEIIVAEAGKSIAAIFSESGEDKFRTLEKDCLNTIVSRENAVIALGGGALLDPENRKLVDSHGITICLHATVQTIASRLMSDDTARPLLDGEAVHQKIGKLLTRRAAHYQAFQEHIHTDHLTPQELAWQIQVRLGLFRVSGMGNPYNVAISPSGLDHIGRALRRCSISGMIAIVSDQNVAALYLDRVKESLRNSGFETREVVIPPGETSKNIDTVNGVWAQFISAGIDRKSTVLALGGGVVGDLAGFAAAAYMRGISWVAVPTSLLAMCDASLGGKTGIDLPEGKNLVGAFHPPTLVLADPEVISTLPDREIKNGMAEVLKAGIIADSTLYDQCSRSNLTPTMDFLEIIRRAVAVKVGVISEDPYESGLRACLNFGHTYGHAIEAASKFSLSHGEAVAIGMLLEAELSEEIGLAQVGLRQQIERAVINLGLPTRPDPDIPWSAVRQHIRRDKKNVSGKIIFALPVKIGDVRTGMAVEEDVICNLYLSYMGQT